MAAPTSLEAQRPIIEDSSTEATSLLGPAQQSQTSDSSPPGEDKWIQENLSADGETTWRGELALLSKSAAPLIVTFALQYSLLVASIVSVGHLGNVELGGVTLGVMSANITAYAVYLGMATSLGTLCPQAYGAGKKHLVGLLMQRMLVMLTILSVPIGVLWWFSAPILKLVILDERVALLASRYLRILILGMPGFFCFECGKHYTQSQGLFTASTYVMAFCAPVNALINWLFVWKLGWGFDGAPIAVVVTNSLLPLGLFLYVYFVAGSECWGGFSKKAFTNWTPMIRLAIPGFVLIEAEWLAFEALTFASSHLGTTSLAGQSILHTTVACMFQIPFSVSVAGSARVGNLIGACVPKAARRSANVVLAVSAVIGLFDLIFVASLRGQLPHLFSSDAEVTGLVARVLPLCAAFQLADAIACGCNGVMRGAGRQAVAGWIQLLCYYLVAMPISFSTAFKLAWGLSGLWTGVAIALALICVVELIYIRSINWQRCVDAATLRNNQG